MLQLSVALQHSTPPGNRDSAVDHDESALGKVQHQVDLVLNQQNTGALAQSLDRGKHLADHGWGQSLERLVEQDQFLRRGQRAGDRKHLLEGGAARRAGVLFVGAGDVEIDEVFCRLEHTDEIHRRVESVLDGVHMSGATIRMEIPMQIVALYP